MTQMDTDGGPQADGELGRIMITDSSDWTDVRLLPCISRKNKKRNPPLAIDANVSYEPLMVQPSKTP